MAGGKWDVTIQMPCCAYAPVTKEVELAPEETQRLDVSLVETLNGSTLGDDPARNAEAMRKRQRVRSGPAPHSASGVPDLSGVWLLTDDPYPESPQLLPPDYPSFRQIFLDGRKHPPQVNPSWMGHSIGHWQKDTLVVDTIGFNDLSLLGGIGGGPFPHTEALQMTERYRRVDYGHMELKVTFEDPQAFAKPYHENLTLTLAPQEELLEFVCENNKPEHLVSNP